MELNGKTILITGGSAGIGLEAAKQFIEQGAKVIITGRDQVKLALAKKKYPSLITINSDASSQEAALSLYNQISELGGIDILYNNAGIMNGQDNLGLSSSKHFEKASMEINTNYLGVILLNDLFMDMLKSRKEAAIINTSSILSYTPSNLVPTYSASKAAVRFYTEALRDHLQIIGSRLKVFELLPPLVKTNLSENMEGKSITPDVLIDALIKAIKNDTYTIRVGDTKAIYWLNRFLPKAAYKLLNHKGVVAKLRS
ncbi:SDR family oxidoreductase [Flavobacterium sp. SORGH_AS_0622]|uniref:SDR family oxidoreductase n=1 Tax=Flavobacterium sp. SORGH_AS_0622 TaxID=3041772 RepID=UPI00278ACECA|nr:SDR family NAD(P)-dependent oxidoreductase [Flavobacterium sp. SORGH_AS_0622]MDQ1166101.1 putative oxidoreductase [Flavobacterium sp. SORGH_AS_0622]